MRPNTAALGLLLASLLAGCTNPAYGTASATIPSRVPRLARVHPGLYRGGQPDAAGFAALSRLGIRTVVDLRRDHDERAAVASAGMDYVSLPMQADLFGSEPPTEDQVREFFDVVLDPAHQPAFVHCALGQDRTGTMIALYRIEVDGWSNAEAIAEMHAYGYHDFFRDLIDYVRRYRRRGYVSAANEPAR